MIEALATGCAALGRPLVTFSLALGRGGSLFGETVFWLSFGWFQPDRVRLGALARHLSDAGIGSLPLTALFGVAIGIVMGIQLTSLLVVADVLGPFLEGFVSVLMREIAPLLMGILVATRSGTALVAALARMFSRKEIDALVGMGIEPVRYLVAPAFGGLFLAVPILNMLLVVVVLLTLSVFAGAGSGFTWQLIFASAVDLVTIGDLAVCLSKGALFATIIAVVSGAYGLGLVGIPRDVGRTLTRSTVVTVGLVLLSNAVVTILTR